MRVLVLQHIACEPPGVDEDVPSDVVTLQWHGDTFDATVGVRT